MKRYPKYKDSGIQWLGQIPEHWDTKKIAELFTERREKVSDKEYPALSVSKAGVTPQLESAVKTDNGDNRKKVCEGDFVVNSRSDRKGSCGISPYTGSVSLINIVLQPRKSVNRSYMHYLLRSYNYIEEFYRIGRGIVADLWTTRYSEAKNIFLPFPPLPEQEKIVEYIDSKTSKIDAYVAERERELKILSELKQSQIAEVVTRGLNPDAPLKDSSVPWIGMVPAHWDVKRFGAICQLKSICNCENEELLSVYLDRGVIRFSEDDSKRTNPTSKDLTNYQLVEYGDFVLNNQQAWRGSVGVSKYRGIVSPAYFIFKLSANLDTDFANYLFRSKNYVAYYHICSKGVGSIQRNLEWGKLKQKMVFIPPIGEQKAIVEYINTKCNHIDTMIANLEFEIAYLKEYKQRLIADAVTGTINVQ